MDEVVVVAHLVLKRPVDEEVQAALMRLVAATRAEDGCLEYVAHLRLDEPRRVLFHERWRDRSCLDRHSASAHLQAFAEALEGRLAAAPEVSLWRKLG